MSDVFDMIDDWGPERVICVSDRRSGMRGVLVVDNTARGMGKGGTRMSPHTSVGEIARLARRMTWKWAAVDLFHGGAKAGILGDPNSPRKEALLRAFARALAGEVPAHYVFGLDLGLSERDAAIFVDELGDRGAAVGLPHALGGLPYDELGVTGFGVAEATHTAAQWMGLAIEGLDIAIQGFGAVGQASAQALTRLGANVVAVSTVAGCIQDSSGIDLDRLICLRNEVGDDCVLEYGGALPAQEALNTDATVFIPAAREDVIDEEVAKRIKARLIVEAANMPTLPSAHTILSERGIILVPDFIANAGGVVAAAHSMDVRYSPFRLEPQSVFDMVSKKLRANVAAVLDESSRHGITPHEAAQKLAQDRVLAAMELRGQLTPRAPVMLTA